MPKKKEEKPKKQKPSVGVQKHVHKSSFIDRLNVRLSHTEKLLFTKYLSVLLASGVPIDEAIDILIQQSKGPLKKILLTLDESVKGGSTLAEGLEHYSYIFPPVYVNLIRAGEASGTLKENLDHLSKQLEKQHDLRQKVRGAMMYPVIVLIAAFLIGTLIFVFVLPKVVSLFLSLKVELPLTTRIILKTMYIVQTYPVYVFSALAAAVILAVGLPQIRFFKPFFHWVVLHTPIVRKISRNSNLARFTRLMGTLLSSGMSITDSLEIAKGVLRNYHFRKLFAAAREGVSQGKTLTDVLTVSSVLIPPMAQRLIRVGEESGSLPEMFEYLAGFYEQEVDDAVRNISSLIEPVMIITIGVMVGVLAFSIISPIYQIVGSV